MIYQVRANLYFTEFDEAKDFYHDCELAYAKSSICNPGTDTAEYGIVEAIENHHDDDPNGPCILIECLTNKPSEPV